MKIINLEMDIKFFNGGYYFQGGIRPVAVYHLYQLFPFSYKSSFDIDELLNLWRLFPHNLIGEDDNTIDWRFFNENN